MTNPDLWWQALGTAVGLGGLLGAVIAVFNSWGAS